MSSQSKKFSCVLAGAESLLIQCGDMLLERGHEVRAIVTASRQIAAWAQAKGLAVVAPGRGLHEALKPLTFDYFFSITNLALIPGDVLALARKASINFHDGPLPRFAGMHAPAWALLAGESEYGVTFHEMTEGADEGGILAQRRFPIGVDDDSLTLNARCYEAAIDAFAGLVDELGEGRAHAIPQNLSERTYFGRHEHPSAACTLDFREPAEALARLVRATHFGRYENTFGVAKLAHRGQIFLTGHAASAARVGGVPGTLLAIGDDLLEISAGDGASIALSSFTSPRGVSLTARQVAARLGVEAGDVLEGPSDAVRLRLTQCSEAASRAESYWVRQLEGFQVADLPARAARLHAAGPRELHSLEVDVPTSFSDRFGAKSGEALVAAFGAYLARVTRRSEVDLAFSDDALRTQCAGAEAFLSALVPMRLEFAAELSTDDLARGISQSPARGRASFLCDVIARYPQLAANASLVRGAVAEIAAVIASEITAYEPEPESELVFVAATSGRAARLVHDARAFPPEAAAEIRNQLATYLQGIGAAAPAQPIREVGLLTAEWRVRILDEWNDTTAAHQPRCVHALFAEQAARTPDQVAVTFEHEALTYRELRERAGQLANYLRSLGVGPDRLVGIFLDRSIEMVVAILGVLEAGGAYLPLDPAYPAERLDFTLRDAAASVVITRDRLTAQLPSTTAAVVSIDSLWNAIAAAAATPPSAPTKPEHLAYVIYTSGSTGQPKGVMVEHRNVSNFFVGMDARIPHDPPGTWLAVTSLSFDISVLELLWTLTRGFKVVIHSDRERAKPAAARSDRRIAFGLAMWGSDVEPDPDAYGLMLESARFGDQRGFSSFHTPERHFGSFGGLFPNAAVTSAALATITSRIKLRASSCVLPLHHPARVAEDWAVVDNLSSGRVEISFATGWHPNDFVIRPSGFAETSQQRFASIATVERLWRGEAVDFENPLGKKVSSRTLPRPIQPTLPVWITSANNVKTFEEAGAHGYNLLTHLLGQTLEEAAEKIAAYRRARAAAGFDPATGVVTLMLHTFVGSSDDEVRELVRTPMKKYLASAMSLVVGFAWSFPAFRRPGDPNRKPEDVDLASLTPEEVDTILEFAFERYFERSGLFGSPDTCLGMVERVKRANVDEICCLIDFGLPTRRVLEGLELLDRVRSDANPARVAPPTEDFADFAIPAEIERHQVSHLQCTPSMAKMLVTNPDARGSLKRVRHLMIGGEAFPLALARELDGLVGGSVTNMYGPTETTIWSSTESVVGSPSVISIGRPIINTQFYVLDSALQPLPVGVPGELCIGGDGVVRGYHGRPELTAARFVPDPFRDNAGARLYRTGDLARWQADGRIEFLGRLDHQVKIRGHRIELGEIEAQLGRIEGVGECVVVAREDIPGDQRLVAYWTSKRTGVPSELVRDALRKRLPEFMLPSAFVPLSSLPMTPNGKIDRKALPAPETAREGPKAGAQPIEGELEQTIADAWKRVLQIESIGADDNFFDLGGHSLLVVQVHRALREECAQKLSLTDLYRFPTVRALATHLGARELPGAAVKDSKTRGELRRQALGGRRRRGAE